MNKRYAIVIVRSDGASHSVARDGHFLTVGQMENDLATLLEQGWRPLRETPMSAVGSNVNYAFSLVVLEKDG